LVHAWLLLTLTQVHVRKIRLLGKFSSVCYTSGSDDYPRILIGDEKPTLRLPPLIIVFNYAIDTAIFQLYSVKNSEFSVEVTIT
jgi:hypothetical protein